MTLTTSESKGRFLQNEWIWIDSHNESNRITNWNALWLTDFPLNKPKPYYTNRTPFVAQTSVHEDWFMPQVSETLIMDTANK